MPLRAGAAAALSGRNRRAPAPAPAAIGAALATQRPAHGDVWITDGHGVRRRLIVTAMPIVGAAGFLGVLALFWEAPATGG